MKKTLSIVVVSLSLLASQALAQSDPFKEYIDWENAAARDAETGRMTFAGYFTAAFDKLEKLPYHPYKVVRMQLFSELIPIARKRDMKQITPDQYSDEARKIYARSSAEYERQMQAFNNQQAQQQAQQQIQEQQLQQQQAMIESQQRAQQEALKESRRQAEISTGLQLLQMARPQAPAAPLRPFGTNCVTRYSNGAAFTNCN